MKILIVGAGDVGFELVKVLTEEEHKVTVLDEDEHRLKQVADNFDVLTVHGSATSPNSLVEAGVRDAELMVAVTNVDEVNIIASTMGKRLGVKSVIARVRNDELSRPDSPLSPSELGIDVLIHPEETTAEEILQLLKRASASDFVDLAGGELQMIGLRVEEGCALSNRTLEEIADGMDDIDFRVVAVLRRGTTVIPGGGFRLRKMDNIFAITHPNGASRLIKASGHSESSLRNILIAGGTEVGALLAEKLLKSSDSWNIKLIEPNEQAAQRMAERYSRILVLHGDPTDPNLLAIEGIQEMDAFVSVTDDEESNIISSLMAKHLGVRKTVAMVSKGQYIPLGQTIGIDSIVNVKAAATDQIHCKIREGMMRTVKGLNGVKAEILELDVKEGSPLTGKPLYKLKLPDGSIVGAIIRNGEPIVATGNSEIEPGDRVLLFATSKAIQKLESMIA
ncbi:MAG: Trk system potassium transporter TrkA [Balneolaceae bacterium]